MIGSIISMNALCIVMLFIILGGCLVENFGKNVRTHIFTLMVMVAIIGTTSDMIPFIVYGQEKYMTLAIFMRTSTMISGIWFAISFVYYVLANIENHGEKVNVWVGRTANMFGSLAALVVIILGATGKLFLIEGGKIVKGPAYIFAFIAAFALCFYSAVIIAMNKKALTLHDRIALYFYVIIPIATSLFEYNIENLSISFIAISISTLVIYSFIQTGEIRNSRMDAQAASLVAKEKSDFIARFSHELRTPINAVIGMDEIIMRTSREEETLSCARDIQSASNTLLSIINDILDSARIESGKVEVIEVTYEPVNMINDLYNLINSRAKSKGLEFTMDIDPNIPCKLYGDEVKIKQIITNLLTNAVKYTTEGRVNLSVGFARNGEDSISLKVAVTDTGIGIKEEDIEKLFSPFSRIDELKNRYVEGTGLGMFITQSFLKMLNSQIVVKSKYGEGSTFSFALNQKVESWTPMGEYDKAVKKLHSKKYVYSASFTARDAKLLIVDDNNVNITVCKRLLKDTLVSCDSATSGFDAIEMCRNKKYDLIFMDQMMPEMDGIETKDRIRSDEDSLNRTTPMVALTANATSADRESLLAIGFDDYLSKPIEYKLMEEVVSRLLPEELVSKSMAN